jgi:hypothetical protein
MRYQFELTDTFDGEANYSWVKREIVTLPDNATDKQIARKLRAFAGYAAKDGKTHSYGDVIEFRPRGGCVVAFALYVEG